jgi:hypothetical protein
MPVIRLAGLLQVIGKGSFGKVFLVQKKGASSSWLWLAAESGRADVVETIIPPPSRPLP